MAVYLALKELWRNKGRFFLISLVIGLITTLVIFVGALAEGLGAGNREYLQKLNGELIVYSKNADLLIGFSQLPRSKLAELQRVPGVRDVGPISFSTVSILLGGDKRLNVSMIGVERASRPSRPCSRGANCATGAAGKPSSSAPWRCAPASRSAIGSPSNPTRAAPMNSIRSRSSASATGANTRSSRPCSCRSSPGRGQADRRCEHRQG